MESGAGAHSQAVLSAIRPKFERRREIRTKRYGTRVDRVYDADGDYKLNTLRLFDVDAPKQTSPTLEATQGSGISWMPNTSRLRFFPLDRW